MLIALLSAVSVIALPEAVRGDFDHDGKVDIARFEQSRPGWRRLVIRPGNKSRPLAVVGEFKEGDLPSMFLTKRKPGKVQTWCGKGGDAGDGPCVYKSLKLRGDTLAFGTKESSEAVAYWTGKGFRVVWVSD